MLQQKTSAIEAMTEDEVKSHVASVVYHATYAIQQLERSGKVVGNSHIIRQQIAEFAAQKVSELWILRTNDE